MKVLDVLNAPWAIIPEKLEEITAIYRARMNGAEADLSSLRAELGRELGNQNESNTTGSLAVISIEGVIAKKMNMMAEYSGGTTLDIVEAEFVKALADDDINTILLLVDSPGGTVAGTQEFANLVYRSRDEKRIVTFVDGTMASAALWIGTAAHEVYISGGTAQVGSIGVIATHSDYSKQLEGSGVTITEITSGEYKAITSENKPLSTKGRSVIQQSVDEIFKEFVQDVAKFRGVGVPYLLDGIADGRVFTGSRSIDVSLADGVYPLRTLLTILKTDGGARSPMMNTNHEEANMPGTTEEAKVREEEANAKALADYNARVAAGVEAQAKADAKKAEELLIVRRAAGAAGAAEECGRIKDVEDQLLPGHEALIHKLKFDGKTTGPEAAMAVLKAEKEITIKAGKGLEDGAPEPVSLAPDGGGVAESVEPKPINRDSSSGLSKEPVLDGDLKAQAKAAWDVDKDSVRADFGTYERFEAYFVAEKQGLVKISG